MAHKEAVEELHNSIHEVVAQVASNLWDTNEKGLDVAAAGFLVNEPGSSSQSFHRDGPDSGMLDVFVPLIDLQSNLGATAIKPGTHIDTNIKSDYEETITPLLRKGECLIFDYRLLHKGQGNQSCQTTRTLAYAVYTKGGDGSNARDVRNFPSAVTLEYD
jgi:ectoine hydroxylase-related dioxygenase (phytanoyl-CoA dioxygenase family)